jgi:plasmid stability protein
MPQLLVRNVSEALVAELKRRAEAHGRSAEAEHRAILEASLKADVSAFLARADAFRAKTAGRIQGDSADLIRQDRDQR